ncbi:MAG: MFS transporter [Anaerolineales bacterium]|nr:MFS transporter [Anaerolineales bacterium]
MKHLRPTLWDRSAGSWAPLAGMLFFAGLMAAGYYYNLTFIQFGLLDLGTRLVGMSAQAVAANMALLAGITAAAALLAGGLMRRQGWSRDLRAKLRLAFGVVAAQTLLTALAPSVGSPPAFTAWIVLASIALGIGVPATFSLAVDLAPVRWRGLIGAAITAGAYLAAAALSASWTIGAFRAFLLPLMLAGLAALGALAWLPLPLADRLAIQHVQPAYGQGRFVRPDQAGRPRVRRRLLVWIGLMFGIYFVDSLGFLRLAETPVFFEAAWQSPHLGPRLAIGLAHALAALIAGVLYTALDEKELFLWVFGLFALVHLMYTFAARAAAAGAGQPVLGQALLYAVAVSLYTVLNFALWADVSTPDTISANSAVGVALSGWTATFVSTALALQLRLKGVPLDLHLRIVDALALLFFLAVLLLIFFAPPARVRKLPAGRAAGRRKT